MVHDRSTESVTRGQAQCIWRRAREVPTADEVSDAKFVVAKRSYTRTAAAGREHACAANSVALRSARKPLLLSVGFFSTELEVSRSRGGAARAHDSPNAPDHRPLDAPRACGRAERAQLAPALRHRRARLPLRRRGGGTPIDRQRSALPRRDRRHLDEAGSGVRRRRRARRGAAAPRRPRAGRGGRQAPRLRRTHRRGDGRGGSR